MAEQGVGARLLRKEDDRLMRGRGEFVADIRLAGMQDVAFVRSPLAHARIRGIRIPPQSADSVFTAADLDGRQADPRRLGAARLQGVRAAGARHRQGAPRRRARSPCASADTRAEAEDIAAPVELDLEELPAVLRHARRARSRARRCVHEHWGDNVFLETFVDVEHRRSRVRRADQGHARDPHRAPVHGADRRARRGRALGPAGSSSSSSTPRRRCRTSCAPAWRSVSGSSRADPRHRARCRRRLRLQGHPAAGGGLPRPGSRMRCGHPVRWIEDRREHLTAGANCREHHYRITAYADRDGRLLRHRLRGHRRFRRLFVLSVLGLPGSRAGREHPARPLRFPALSLPHLVGRDQQARSCPIAAWRAPACASRSRSMLDAIAREAGLEPYEVRLEEPRAARADAVRQHHQEAFRQRRLSAKRCAARWRRSARRRARAPAAQASRTAASSASASRSTASRPRTAPPSMPAGASRWCRATSRRRARFTPDGGLELRIGAHSHGQGLETTLAQVAHEILGVDRQDQASSMATRRCTPYSTGTWGSRCMVMAGGAVAAACAKSAQRVDADRRANCCRPTPRTCSFATARCVGRSRQRHARRDRAHLVSPAAGSAADVDPAASR